MSASGNDSELMRHTYTAATTMPINAAPNLLINDIVEMKSSKTKDTNVLSK